MTLTEVREQVERWRAGELRRSHPECITVALAAARRRMVVAQLELLTILLEELERETKERCLQR